MKVTAPFVTVYTQTSAHYTYIELTIPKAVVLGLNLNVQGCSDVMAINFAESAYCSPCGHSVDYGRK